MSNQEVELRMWRMLKDSANDEPHHRVRIAKLADGHLPVPHKQWTTQTVKRWQNMGLVIAYENGAHAALTEDGVLTDTPAHLEDAE